MTIRRSLDETRDLLLQAGLELFATEGIAVALDDVKVIDVCRAAGLRTAGSAYKIWPTQDAFRADLFRYLIDRASASFATIGEIDAELAASSAPPDLRELIRTATAANAERNRPLYPTYVTLWLLAHTDESFTEVFTRADERWLQVVAEFFTALFDLYDLELIPPYTTELFATSVSALVEGFAIRRRATPELVPDAVLRATGPEGTPRDWTLYGCAVEALFTAFTRPRAPRT